MQDANERYLAFLACFENPDVEQQALAKIRSLRCRRSAWCKRTESGLPRSIAKRKPLHATPDARRTPSGAEGGQ